MSSAGAAVADHSGPIPLADIVGLPNCPPLTASVGGESYERYEKILRLGEGTYGVVYRARDRQRNCDVALKKVRMTAWEDGVPATALREICALKELSHPNIVDLHDVFVSFSGNLYLVFELLERDLKSALDPVRARGGFDAETTRSYMHQLLLAIEACHSHRMIHRDIKPQNILLGGPPGSGASASAGSGGDASHAAASASAAAAAPSAAASSAASSAAAPAVPLCVSSPVVKLADFGLARTFGLPLRAYTHEIITLWYRCPEVLLGQAVYSAAVDVWSLGCIFGEMACGAPLFTGDSEIDQLFRIFRVLGTPSDADWPLLSRLPDYSPAFPAWPKKPWSLVVPRLCDDGRALLGAMLAYDPAKRISAAEALAHPYFAPLRSAAAARAAATAAAAAAAAAASAGAGVVGGSGGDDVMLEL